MLKLIESLRHCTASEGDCRSCPHYTHDSGCLDRLHIEAADLLESQQKRIAELEEKNRWSPVTERLPGLIPCGTGDELKPCPFCEGTARVTNWGLHHAWCVECCATSGDYLTRKEAVAAWNRRVERVRGNAI